MPTILNPVAALILRATVEWPLEFGPNVLIAFHRLARRFLERIEPKYEGIFPAEPEDTRIAGFLWSRTVICPYCRGVVPLSPNWRLAPNGTGVRLRPQRGEGPGSRDRVCSFEIVASVREQSEGTVARGTGTCPYPDCGHVVDGDEIKQQAQTGEMGEQLFAVAFKKRIKKYLKSGKRGKDKWVRGYRAPQPEDDNSTHIRNLLAEKLPEWEALDLIPSERIPDGNKTTEPHRYGMSHWCNLFSPRQLLCHGTSVEVYREILAEDRAAGNLTPCHEAAYGYLALSLDKLRDYNSRMSVWHSKREVMTNTFSQHDFSFKWSYAEMAPMIVGLGYNWVIEQTAKCIEELVTLISPTKPGDNGELFGDQSAPAPPPVMITCKSADSLDHIEDGSVDAIVMDPPYYGNVMYAELSDFLALRCWGWMRGGRVAGPAAVAAGARAGP